MRPQPPRAVRSRHGELAVHDGGGDGPAVLLVPGNPASHRAFAGPLATRYRRIAVDLPGHGDSPGGRRLPA